MGMFDYVDAVGPEFTCSRGHQLDGLQTKSFVRGLAVYRLAMGQKVTIERDGVHGVAEVDAGQCLYAQVYATCERCPCFVEPSFSGGWMLKRVWCEFRVHVRDGVVVEVVRTSESTDAFIDRLERESGGPAWEPAEADAELRRRAVARFEASTRGGA